MSELIARDALPGLVDKWLAQGKRVAGPSVVKPGHCLYIELESSAQLALEGFIRPRNSIKEFVFPRHEAVCRYHFSGHSVETDDCDPPQMDQVIVGARPCDAAALPILDHLFTWDYDDKFYTERRKATTVVTLACQTHDDECFCTSMHLGPAAEQGADVLLLAMPGGYEVRCLTDKGRALFAGETQAIEQAAVVPPGPPVVAAPETVMAFLQAHYDDPLWADLALRCLGCGACAYTCPTCHCFDIVDEGTAAGGCRVKNWDCCQFSMFTQHASGHNPRSGQALRQRQRIQHKFRIYPEKFGVMLCTGCDNCARNCPVGLGVLSTLKETAGSAPVEVGV